MPVRNTESIFRSTCPAAFGGGGQGPRRAHLQVEHLYRSAHFRDPWLVPRKLRGFLIVSTTKNGPFSVPLGLEKWQ